jgi:hypothetical protein
VNWFLKYNVLFRALFPEKRFGKGVPNQIHGFQIFRNVVPEVDFYKGKNENPGGKKESWGWDEKIAQKRVYKVKN